MDKNIITKLLTNSFIYTLTPYARKNIANNINTQTYQFINSWLICVLQTYNLDYNNIHLHHIKHLHYNNILLIFLLSQFSIYSTYNYFYLIKNMSVSDFIMYSKILDSFLNLAFAYFFDDSINKNKIIGIIVLSSGFIIYNI